MPKIIFEEKERARKKQNNQQLCGCVGGYSIIYSDRSIQKKMRRGLQADVIRELRAELRDISKRKAEHW